MPGMFSTESPYTPEMTKHEKITAIDVIWDFEEQHKTIALIGIANDYFTHYGIKMPNELWEDTTLNPLIYPNDKKEVKKCLSDLKDFAIKYHNETTPQIKIDHDITKRTLIKLIKKTFYGSRLDEMGINGSTLENIEKGFIAYPVLEIIINIMNRENVTSDLIIAFGNKHKINYIRQKLSEL